MPPQLSTWGFEAEFQTGAADVIASLFAKGLTGDGVLHGYHCDCDLCMVGNEWPVKGQADSTCSGEIISNILVHKGMLHPLGLTHNADEILEEVQKSAIEVDAEPGLTSGFHVHVGISHLNPEQRGRAFLAYLKWEPLLVKLATGRWTGLREGVNRSLRDSSLRDANQIARWAGVQSVLSWHEWFTRREEFREWATTETRMHSSSLEGGLGSQLQMLHEGRDRHSFLNVSTNHPTWEFRLWNSTRSAWRMDMHSRVSVAMMDPAVSTQLLEENFPQRLRRETLNRFGRMLAECEHEKAAELIEKQAWYLTHRATNAPSTLTSIN